MLIRKNLFFCLSALFLTVIGSSCEEIPQKNGQKIPTQADTLQALSDTAFSSKKVVFAIKDFLSDCPKDTALVAVFEGSLVVSIVPTEKEIKEKQTKMGKSYDEMLESYTNSFAELKVLLDANKVPVKTTSKRYLKFIAKNKKQYCLDTYRQAKDSLTLRWNAVAFHLDKMPAVPQQSPPSPEEMQKYFDIK